VLPHAGQFQFDTTTQFIASLATLFLHCSVIDQLVREMKNKLQEETEKEVK